MRTIKELFEVYKPKSPDEQKFIDKHVTIKHKDRNGNDDDVFNATNVKTSKRKEERHGYEPGEDEKVYEDLEISDEELVFELEEEVEPLEEGTVGYKHYTITSHPKMAGVGEGGDIKHVYGHPKKMGKLGIEHDDSTDYGTTRRVIVKNNETGETTHHHVYQSERSNSTGKPTLSIRTVGKAGAQQDKHANVIAHYLSGKTKIKEDTDLAFFEDLLEMNLDEDTFTDASLAQLRVMKHKQEMKKIESSSKLHPLMKVRKLSDAKKKLADLEAARDHYVAKHEKAQAKKKKVAEEVEDLDEGLMHDRYLRSHGKKARGTGSWAFTTKQYGSPKENEMHFTSGQKSLSDAHKEAAAKLGTKHLYVMEEVEDLDESAKIADHLIKRYGDNVRKSHVRSAANDFGVGFVALSHAVRKKLGVNRLEEEQLDELSFKKLAAYTAKSADSVSGTPVRKQDNRIKGQSLADKKIRKMDGYSSTAKVAATNGKLTKEDIINRAIENYMPEEYVAPSLDEQFIAKIDHLSEAHAVTLLALFDSLNEENKKTMLETVDTQEGINSLLDFAIKNRGE